MKICVYAIAKNESKFIDRWYNSVKEADYICVLDTGSTDGSEEIFKRYPIIFNEAHYESFRFDVARNDSLKFVPADTDVCVCVDIDEMFEPGWSKIIKENWKNNIGRIRYRYTWNFNPDGSEGTVFMADKIHKYGNYKWVNPVHEILQQTDNQPLPTIDLPNIKLYHRADDSKSRCGYLPLLELSVLEDPNNDRNMHYLGREYMFYNQYDKAIQTLKKHLLMPTATWAEERCASYRYIANCYKMKNDLDNQEKYLILAILECPDVREPYYELAMKFYDEKKYSLALYTFNEMLKIKKRELNYISSPLCWSSVVYDYMSICCYYINDIKRAIYYVDLAMKDNNDERLKQNKNFYLSKI